ncbi:unnamed protein product [Rotaria sp. Silwood1]|nr:unnamed protein product [Rotaria sp. Silwood1]
MASSWTRGDIHMQSTTVSENQYFIITITNYPNLLQRTQSYQQPPNNEWQQRFRGGMLAPNVPIHFGVAQTEEHESETLLYNTLQFELEECIRAYLQRTQRLYPINLEWQQRFRGGMLAPNVPIHFGVAHTEEHETLLYNTLQFELEECIRAYLQRTQRLYPINLNDQPQQRFQSTFDWPTQLLVKNEAHDTALDEQFIAKLRQLIYEYMQHTTRPLPLKYFLDLTEE